MEKEEKIHVVVRARPYVRVIERKGSTPRNINRVKLENGQECVAASPENPGELFVYTDPAHTRAATFRCETFLPSTSSQDDVFNQIRAKELVNSALDGFPVTIFAYGQTGAGKSFTIFGKEDDVTERKMALQEQDGLLPRIAQELMNAVSARKSEIEYTLRVTCVEIYNELVRDIFDPRKETLAVRSSKTHGFFLENATVVECMTAREIVRVVKAAATQRTKSSHLLNELSVFRILARWEHSFARRAILIGVFTASASLGGNCKTLMIACVNSSPQFAVESVRTLEFAMGVAKIKNRPTALLTPHEKLIKDLREQIRLLKLENKRLRARTPGYFMEHPNNELDPFTNAFAEQQLQPCTEPMYLSADSLEVVHRKNPSVHQKVVQQELRTLKQKPQFRHLSKSPKMMILKHMSKSFTNKHALLPVSKSAPPPRLLQYIASHPEPAHSNQITNHLMLPRTDSPPPPYNDLFGIETISYSQSQPSSNRSSPHLPPARPAHAPASSLPNNGETNLPASNLSPEEQLQLLLKQMLPESQPPLANVPERTDRRHKLQKMPSKSAKPPAFVPSRHNNYSPVNESSINNNSAEWDDQRAQDLFLQLCRL
ncbi:hypothetical protein PI125_g10982 [Phytophthora idaei]|nr:hypothetical protein PI125_g10982 [Phytophthora idaei]KAG3152897.1 hypothetical protein PI126_g10308 [Phytophthora idaei]